MNSWPIYNDTAHAFYKNLILIYRHGPDLVYEALRVQKRSKIQIEYLSEFLEGNYRPVSTSKD